MYQILLLHKSVLDIHKLQSKFILRVINSQTKSDLKVRNRPRFTL